MDIYDWSENYIGSYEDSHGVIYILSPLHDINSGFINRGKKGDLTKSSYILTQKEDDLFMQWMANRYRIQPTENGFKLIIGDVISYELFRTFE